MYTSLQTHVYCLSSHQQNRVLSACSFAELAPERCEVTPPPLRRQQDCIKFFLFQNAVFGLHKSSYVVSMKKIVCFFDVPIAVTCSCYKPQNSTKCFPLTNTSAIFWRTRYFFRGNKTVVLCCLLARILFRVKSRGCGLASFARKFCERTNTARSVLLVVR